jgi:dolichyl-phosphate beta-glucosyltransferase
MQINHVQDYGRYQKWQSEKIDEAPYLSIIIPAYNESERIVPTIGAIASYVSGFGLPWELIVADDGSTDETVSILEDLQLANMRVLVAEQNGGKGSAVRRGMLAAEGEFILFADADNSTPIEQLGKMLQQMESGYDVLIGSRAADGSQAQNRDIIRRSMSWGLHSLVHMILRVDVSDTQCGFKLFRREAAVQLCQYQTLMGFSFDLELLYLTEKLGFSLGETPVNWYDAPGSKVNVIRDTRRFLVDLVRIRVNDSMGYYTHKGVLACESQ